jgi:hypothetical protein
LKLASHKGCSGFVADGVKETGDGEVFFFAILDVLDAELCEKVPITLALDRYGVPEDGLG